MKIIINRYTCDICKREFDVKEDNPSKSPLIEVVLPIENLDEHAVPQSISTKRIEVCPCCLGTLHEVISDKYLIYRQKYSSTITVTKRES